MPNFMETFQNESTLSNFRVETNKAKPQIMKIQKIKDVFTTPQKNGIISKNAVSNGLY